jgi:hypothetical protein
MTAMFNLNNLYRWCDAYGGGIIIAESPIEAQEKLEKALDAERNINEVVIWPWTNDDYFDEHNPEVLDIY